MYLKGHFEDTSTHLPSGESEPSDDAPRRRLCGWRWSGRSSLSNAIMFHSCLRFRAFLTFFTSRWRVLLSMFLFCSWYSKIEGHKKVMKTHLPKTDKNKAGGRPSPFASASLSSSPLCPEASSPSTVQKSMMGLSRISLHLGNPLCIKTNASIRWDDLIKNPSIHASLNEMI